MKAINIPTSLAFKVIMVAIAIAVLLFLVLPLTGIKPLDFLFAGEKLELPDKTKFATLIQTQNWDIYNELDVSGLLIYENEMVVNNISYYLGRNKPLVGPCSDCKNFINTVCTQLDTNPTSYQCTYFSCNSCEGIEEKDYDYINATECYFCNNTVGVNIACGLCEVEGLHKPGREITGLNEERMCDNCIGTSSTSCILDMNTISYNCTYVNCTTCQDEEDLEWIQYEYVYADKCSYCDANLSDNNAQAWCGLCNVTTIKTLENYTEVFTETPFCEKLRSCIRDIAHGGKCVVDEFALNELITHYYPPYPDRGIDLHKTILEELAKCGTYDFKEMLNEKTEQTVCTFDATQLKDYYHNDDSNNKWYVHIAYVPGNLTYVAAQKKDNFEAKPDDKISKGILYPTCGDYENGGKLDSFLNRPTLYMGWGDEDWQWWGPINKTFWSGIDLDWLTGHNTTSGEKVFNGVDQSKVKIVIRDFDRSDCTFNTFVCYENKVSDDYDSSLMKIYNFFRNWDPFDARIDGPHNSTYKTYTIELDREYSPAEIMNAIATGMKYWNIYESQKYQDATLPWIANKTINENGNASMRTMIWTFDDNITNFYSRTFRINRFSYRCGPDKDYYCKGEINITIVKSADSIGHRTYVYFEAEGERKLFE